MATGQKRHSLETLGELNRVRMVGIGSSGEMTHVHFSSSWKILNEPATEEIEKLLGDLVVFILDATDYDDRAKARIASLVAHNLPIVATHRASASDFLWELKPTVEARGGIMEIATAKEDLVRRVKAVSKAVTMRHCFLAHTWIEQKHEPSSLFTPFFGQLKHTYGPPTESEEIGTLPGVVHATQFLRSEKGLLDAERIRELFGFTRKDLASHLQVSAESIRQKSDADSLQAKLVPFERIARLLMLNPKHDDFRRWLHTPNSEFGDEAPLSIIAKSGPEGVADLVEDIITNRGR